MTTLLLFLALANPVQAEDYVDWYGTYTIDYSWKKETTEDYPKGHAYYPGKRLESETLHSAGTIEFLPGKLRIDDGYLEYSHTNNRKSEYETECTWPKRMSSIHDYEYREQIENAGGPIENHNATLSIYLDDEGNYKLSNNFSVKTDLKGGAIHNYREMFDGCSGRPASITDFHGTTSTRSGGVSLKVARKADSPHPDTIAGEDTQTLPDGSKLFFTWNFTRAVPRLIARINGPRTFTRGDVVTLDASPSSGDITEYLWRFSLDPEKCPASPDFASVVLKGPKVSFRALCSFRAHLTLKDSFGQGAPTKIFDARVKARQGKEWDLFHDSKPGDNLTSPMFAEMMRVGVNQCARHKSDVTTGHQIHTNAPNNATWLDDGYEAEEVADGGPFSGTWYVKKQMLAVDRVERVNGSLLGAGDKGGEVYLLNRQKQNSGDEALLLAQVRAHEAMHSTLVFDALKTLGPEGDPGHQVEAVVAPSRELLQTLADMKVREVESILYEATSDDRVKDRLASQSAFRKEAKIWFPRNGSDEKTLKNLGPFWAIGD